MVSELDLETTKEIPERLMLDPSLLLSKRTLPVVESAWAAGELAGVVLPASFVRTFSAGALTEPVLRYFRGTPEPDEMSRDSVPNLGRLTRFLRELRDSEAIYQAGNLPDEAFANSLSIMTRDSVVTEILVEEWLFLTSSSVIASRTKRPFSTFVRAGAVAMEWGRDRFDSAAARVLKLPPDRLPKPLLAGQRLRAVCKWIAIGGRSVAPLLGRVAGTAGSLISGIFMLYDP
jgi:hypothetical protein